MRNSSVENYLDKSILELERRQWAGEEPIEGEDSRVTWMTYSLLNKNLQDFDVEDLRFMVGQKEGLTYLIPLAIKVLKKNILAEGRLYPGDLLTNVLSIDNSYWEKHEDQKKEICKLFKSNINLIRNCEDLTREIREDIFLLKKKNFSNTPDWLLEC